MTVLLWLLCLYFVVGGVFWSYAIVYNWWTCRALSAVSLLRAYTVIFVGLLCCLIAWPFLAYEFFSRK